MCMRSGSRVKILQVTVVVSSDDGSSVDGARDIGNSSEGI